MELASDHKEFATVMARTKLAELSDSVKVIPIGGIPPEKAKLLEQLNKNKDQPVIKSPSKKIGLKYEWFSRKLSTFPVFCQKFHWQTYF